MMLLMLYVLVFWFVLCLLEFFGVFFVVCLLFLFFDVGVLNLFFEFFCDNLGAVWFSCCLSEVMCFWVVLICLYKVVVEMLLFEFVFFGMMVFMILRFFFSDDLGLFLEFFRLFDFNVLDLFNFVVVVVDGFCGVGIVFFFVV